MLVSWFLPFVFELFFILFLIDLIKKLQLSFIPQPNDRWAGSQQKGWCNLQIEQNLYIKSLKANNGAVAGHGWDFNLSPTENMANAFARAGENVSNRRWGGGVVGKFKFKNELTQIDAVKEPVFETGYRITAVDNWGAFFGGSSKANKLRKNAAINAENICNTVNYYAKLQHLDNK